MVHLAATANQQIALITTPLLLLWFTDLCYPFISDRQVHLALIFLLLLDLSTRLLRQGTIFPDEYEIQHLLHQNQDLIKENGALSITIKNMSDEHTLLCEIRSTLSRQRKDLIHMMHDEHAVARRALQLGSRSEGCITLNS